MVSQPKSLGYVKLELTEDDADELDSAINNVIRIAADIVRKHTPVSNPLSNMIAVMEMVENCAMQMLHNNQMIMHDFMIRYGKDHTKEMNAGR